MKKFILASVLASSMVAPLLASSAMAEPTPPPAHGEHKPKPPHEKGPGHKGPEHKKGPHGKHSGMRMAEKLSAMETAVGIRSDQLDAWRKYTSSFVDMTDMTPPKPEEAAAEAKNKPIFGERMADMTIERAEKAAKFKTAAEELRKVLDAEQLKKMEEYGKHPHGPAHGGPDAPKEHPKP
ncbi:hypothetical protein [Bartonella sp. LJL80]